ncbi:Hypothetical predicted protein [Olea europaea subsp. europaea]|uniref:Uncharacterized protein n=1 Tax=Olea europaea subsp. europaea TaxID=158383 RepID=A0A8S0TY56_OLEEU|nr:Hypothetical predicted protein [Olea europaea subsp. europaea]
MSVRGRGCKGGDKAGCSQQSTTSSGCGCRGSHGCGGRGGHGHGRGPYEVYNAPPSTMYSPSVQYNPALFSSASSDELVQLDPVAEVEQTSNVATTGIFKGHEALGETRFRHSWKKGDRESESLSGSGGSERSDTMM